MSRRFNTNRIRRQLSYSVQEICELLGVHKNTVRGWLKDGLPKTDNRKPYLIHGDDLRQFLNERQKARAKKCRLNEFYCLRCRTQRRSIGNMVDVRPTNTKTVMLSGLCEVCETALNKVQSRTRLPEILATFDISERQQAELFGPSTHSLNCDLKEGRHT